MVHSPALRPWWRCPGPLLAVLLHAGIFLGFFQLHFADGEWERIRQRIGPDAGTGEWIDALVEDHGVKGLLVWFFDTHNEIRLYHRYAQVTLRGVDPARPADAPEQGRLVPYRDVAVEYQPGALLVMLPPALLAPDYEGYLRGFVVWCGLLYGGALALGLRLLGGNAPLTAAEANRALWWSAAFLLCFGGVAAARFDHAVPLLLLAGLALFLRAERTGSLAGFAACGAVIAVGVMVKIVPGVLLPAAGLWLAATGWHRWWRAGVALGAGFGLTLAVLHGIFYALWGEGYLRSYTYHVERGIQLESTYAGVIAAADGFGRALAVTKDYGAYHLVTPLTAGVKALVPWLFLLLAALVAGRLVTSVRAAKNPAVAWALLGSSLLFLLAFILTNKVLSPQYLLWLGPLVAAAYGRQPDFRFGALLLLAAAALSQAIFPHFYDQLTGLEPALVAVLNLRNLLLGVLFGWLLWRLPRFLPRRDSE